MPSTPRVLLAGAILACALVLAAITYGYRASHTPTGIGTALVGGPFSLIDQNGRRVTEKDFRGKFMLVFFGYTFCPDICPTELQVMSQALDDMGTKGDSVQPIFITIDPGRDTPEVLKPYLENFGTRFIGLTGSAGEIEEAARNYRVYYKKGEKAGTDAYLMDHTSIFYLMGPDGTFLKHFTYSTDAKALASAIAAAMLE